MATSTSVEVQELRENTGVTLYTKLYFTYNVNYTNQRIEISNCYMSAKKGPNVSTVIATPQSGAGDWTWRVYSPQADISGKTYGDYTFSAQVRTSEVKFYTSSGTTNTLSFNIPFSNITWGGTTFSFTLAGRLLPPPYSTWASNDNNRPSKTVTISCPTYTVAYNMNGGSGTISSQTKYYNKSLTLSSTKPTRSGYTFKGWSTSSSATSPTYQAGGTYTNNAGATLYAVWSYDGDYNCTVSYKIDPNQSGISISSSTYSYTSAGDIYKNGSWYYDWAYDSGSTVAILAPSTFGLSRTGYALSGNYHAEADPSLTVAGGTNKTYSQLSSGMITRQYSNGSYYKSIYLVVNWTPNKYTVTLDRQNGSGGSSSVTATYDSSMPNISTPTRTGYTFQGYYSSKNGEGTKYYNSSGTSTKIYNIASATTLYAYWEPIEYTISYSLNGGEFSDNGFNKAGSTGNPVLYNPQGSIAYGSGNYKIDKPTKTGYTFDYFKFTNLDTSTAQLWYSEDGTNSWHSPSSSTISLTSEQSSNLWIKDLRSSAGTVTITAYYTPNKYTVTYNANGGSGTMPSSTATYNTNFLTRPNTFYRRGYRFLGWNEKANGTGTQWSTTSTGVYENNQTAQKWTYTNNITLYAQWEVRGQYVYQNDTKKWVKVVPFFYYKGVWKEAIPYTNTSDSPSWKSLTTSSLTIVSQPSVILVNVAKGSSKTYSIAVNQPDVTYSWEVSTTSPSTGFSTLSNQSGTASRLGYAGQGTSDLKITVPTNLGASYLKTYYFRCKVSKGSSTVYSWVGQIQTVSSDAM